ncbi:MAG: hypothetical protein ACW98D_20970 [Promethearchaeota archaeon]|jgi:hypothetical protein
MNQVPEFDPYKLLLKRKSFSDNPMNIPKVSFEELDIKALEAFCKQHGIMGMNFGNMDPKAVLRMLKAKMGVIEEASDKKMLLD